MWEIGDEKLTVGYAKLLRARLPTMGSSPRTWVYARIPVGAPPQDRITRTNFWSPCTAAAQSSLQRDDATDFRGIWTFFLEAFHRLYISPWLLKRKLANDGWGWDHG